MSPQRVLSIQSHVVSGYVGNKCATFSLQLLGIEVDSINSVQLSNHTGKIADRSCLHRPRYPVHPGQVLDSSQLEHLIEGLRANGIFTYSHILTGYAGNFGFLKKVVEIIKDAKVSQPNLLYVCDPVMGDDGILYVPKELIPIYRDELVPLSDILTPNQFEAELLSGVNIDSEGDALAAIDALHEIGARTVVITGTNLNRLQGQLTGFASNGIDRWRFDVPFVEGSFTGTGDLFTSVLTGWMAKGYGLKESVERAVSTLQHVLLRTLDSSYDISVNINNGCCGDGPIPTIKSLSSTMDVQIVKNKAHIEDPEVIVKLKKLMRNTRI